VRMAKQSPRGTRAAVVCSGCIQRCGGSDQEASPARGKSRSFRPTRLRP
jgi:hypothetical protein